MYIYALRTYCNIIWGKGYSNRLFFFRFFFPIFPRGTALAVFFHEKAPRGEHEIDRLFLAFCTPAGRPFFKVCEIFFPRPVPMLDGCGPDFVAILFGAVYFVLSPNTVFVSRIQHWNGGSG